jgi:hypothetical protein
MPPTITFTPDAEDHIAFFADGGRPVGLRLVWGTKVTSRDGRIVLHDEDWSLSVSARPPTADDVRLCVRGQTVHMPFSTFEYLVGRTVYLSHGHSSDPTVTCGDLLKVRW